MRTLIPWRAKAAWWAATSLACVLVYGGPTADAQQRFITRDGRPMHVATLNASHGDASARDTSPARDTSSSGDTSPARNTSPAHDASLIAFTEPYRVIELAAAEIGRIAMLNIRRGSQVREGDLLCELDVATWQARRRTIEQRAKSTSRRDALEIERDRKQRRFASFKAIAVAGGGTPEEIAEAEADAKIATLNVRAADEELEQVRLEMAEIDAQIEQRRIRAQMNGIIIDVHRQVGEFVSASDPKVATLVDLSRLRASFFLPTEAVAAIGEQMPMVLQFAQSQQAAAGVVEYVGPLTNADSGRVRVDVVIDNSQGIYRSGMRCVLSQQHPSKDR